MVLRESIALKTAIVLTACLFPREIREDCSKKMATWQMRGLSKARYHVVASTRQGRGLTPHSYPRPVFTANSLPPYRLDFGHL
jgi:hypothetical protein